MSWHVTPAQTYLASGAVSALATAYALRPARRPGYAAAMSLPLAWPASEQPVACLAVQIATTGLAVRRGVFRTRIGAAGGACAAAATAGLLFVDRRARRTGEVLEAALDQGLGPDYRERRIRDGGRASSGGTRSAVVPIWGARPHYGHDSDVSYGPNGHSNLLDVWHRPDLPRTARAPVLLHVPGGGYVVANKRWQAYPLLRRVAEGGWVCVSMSYRPAAEVAWPGQIIDVKRALSWVKEHIADYGGDPGFVAITGGSAGAQLAALAALTPGDPCFQPGFEDADTAVQAAVPCYGVYDWTPPQLWPAMQSYLLRYKIMSKPYEKDKESYEAASPARRVGRASPPFFVLHGGNDVFAPAAGARRFSELLRAAGVTVAYGELPGAQHAFDVVGGPRASGCAESVARFLDFVRDAAVPRPTADGRARPAD
jgi:acetyl esterase/lipase